MNPKFQRQIEALECRIAPATLVGLDTNNNLLIFDSATPNLVTSVPVNGIGGETLVGIDFRPADGLMYGVTKDGSNAYLYTIDLSGYADYVTDIDATLEGTSFGVDFDPLQDALRVVSNTGQNVQVDVTNGDVFDNGSISPGTETVGAIAYSNNFVGALGANAPTFFDISTSTGTLFTQNQFTGALTPVGSLGITISSPHSGFDIQGKSTTGFAAFQTSVDGDPDPILSTDLYTINLATGASTKVGQIGDGSFEVTGLTAVPESPDLKIVNANTATYTDADGDLVTVKVSNGSLDVSNFTFGRVTIKGASLVSLNLTDDPAGFTGAKISITAKRGPTGGDGFVNVGEIYAGGINLGNVKVNGDLGSITAGTGELNAIAAGSIDVVSLGALADAGPYAQGSYLAGSATSIKIRTEMGSGLSEGPFSDSGGLFVEGGLTSLTIGGDLLGSSVFVGGSVQKAAFGGAVFLGGVVINGDVSTLNFSGGLLSAYVGINGAVGKFKVGGQVYGSAITVSGHDSPANASEAVAIDQLKVRGGVIYSEIRVGYEADFGPFSSLGFPGDFVNPDVQVNKIAIGGNFRDSAIIVGTVEGFDEQIGKPFGGGSDDVLAGDGGDPLITAKIAQLTIKGQATASGFGGGIGLPFLTSGVAGILAEEIGLAKVGPFQLPLTLGAGNDDVRLGANEMFHVKETNYIPGTEEPPPV